MLHFTPISSVSTALELAILKQMTLQVTTHVQGCSCMPMSRMNANMALMALQASRRKLSAGTPAVANHTTPAETEVDRWSEVEVWHHILHLMEVAKQKQGNALNTLPCYVLCSLSFLK